jgi:hypothetical protein
MAGAVALAVVLGGTIPAAAAGAAVLPKTAVLDKVAQPRATVVSSLTAGSRISCDSPTACLAVGSDTDSAGNTAPNAEVLRGTKWKSVSVKTPKGAAATALTDVSCKSASYCLVVGMYANSDDDQFPYALTWNGSVLTPITAPPAPNGYTLAGLNAVSCLAVKSCVVVGTSENSTVTNGNLSASVKVFTDTWNGRTWKAVTTTAPKGSFLYELSALRCFSVTACIAVGENITLTGASTVVAATWNGKTWTAQKAVTPAGGEPFVNDLSCASAKSCAVAGFTSNASGNSGFGFVETWNGKTWSEVKWSPPKGDTETLVLGVSCVSAANCMAVGAAGTSKSFAAAARSWNGKTWTALKVPGPAKGDSSDLEGISCPKAGDCVAIGEVGKSGGSTTSPLAGYWNGKAWKVAAA